MRAWILVLMTVAMAGCTSPTAPADDPVPEPPTYEFWCPEGATGTPCHVQFDSPRYHYTEPYVAVHPTDPAVWAVSAMAGGNPAYTAEEEKPEGAWTVANLHFWFTEDGGTTWRTSELPKIPNPSLEPYVTKGVVDPVMVLDPDGVVHVTGILNFRYASAGQATQSDTFYARSEDTGRTWGEVEVLSDGGFNDRNWMVDAGERLVTVWSRYAERDDTVIAWSDDRGQAWDRIEIPGCPDVGQPVYAGDVMLACRVDSADGGGEVVVYAFDGGIRELSRIAIDCYKPHLFRVDTGFALVPAICPSDEAVWTYTEDFTTWSVPQPIADLVGVPVDTVLWQASDGAANLHLLTKLSDPDHFGRTAAENSRVTYSIVDWRNASLLEQEMLHDFAERPDTSPQDGTGIGGDHWSGFFTGDHYNGLGWAHGRGLIAWTQAGDIHTAFVESATEQVAQADFPHSVREAA